MCAAADGRGPDDDIPGKGAAAGWAGVIGNDRTAEGATVKHTLCSSVYLTPFEVRPPSLELDNNITRPMISSSS